MSDERPPTQNPWFAMRPLPRAIGVVLLVVGTVWLLQGIGVAQGSVMTGKVLWAFLGAVGIVAGAVVLRRAHATARAAIAADAAERSESTRSEAGDQDRP